MRDRRCSDLQMTPQTRDDKNKGDEGSQNSGKLFRYIEVRALTYAYAYFENYGDIRFFNLPYLILQRQQLKKRMEINAVDIAGQ